MSTVQRALIGFAFAVWVPSAAYAQAAIAGLVKDTSGAILPGVTVEAASPALIEKTRTVVTDGTGQYRIEDLRPGVYGLTFTLAGFSNVRREGIELTGSLTATVSVELRVGSVEETVTVTGDQPIVDVQSARRQEVLTNDVLVSIPTVRNYNALLPLVPGITTGTNDVFIGPIITLFSFHGGPSTEGRVLVDGIIQGNVYGGNSVSNYVADIGNSQEVSFTTSGGLGEAETAGVLMNIVPKTGGNRFTGSFFASAANSSLQASNYTQALKDAGLKAPNPLRKVYDVDGAYGGPIVRDKLWYFGNARAQGTNRYVTSLYYNKNAGDPTKWTYEPDLTRQAYSDRTWNTVGLRLTWQVTPRNKVSVYWDEQPICLRCTGATSVNQSPDPLTSPEAQGISILSPQRVQQVSWKSPLTSRVLIEVGLGTYFVRWDKERPDNVTSGLVRVTEQCTAGCAINGNIPGLNFRAQQWTNNWGQAYNPLASISYVTGAHSMKFGYQGFIGIDQNSFTNTTNLAYRVNNGVPNQLTMYGDPIIRLPRTIQTSFYAQEQWTHGRLTLQGAVRYDRAASHFLDEQVGPTRFIPTPLFFPRQDGVEGYQDITPRAGAAYDVFGNGKTALKFNITKYLQPASVSGIYINTNPVLLISSQVTRSWVDANANFVPDCDLLNPLSQDLRTSNGDLCGAMSNQNFAKPVFSSSYDPVLLKGWGVRPSDWNLGVSLQHQLLTRTSIEIGYYRRWDYNFIVTDNRAVSASDYDSFCINAPTDDRLPGGGGQAICNLYDVSPTKFGQVDNFVTLASKYGKQTSHWQGVDITANARIFDSLTVQGGFSNGQTVTDNCEIRTALPETAPLNPYCHVATGFLPQIRGLASYTIPKLDVQLGTTFQSKLVFPLGLAANYSVANAAIVPSLGRSLAGNVPNVTVNLIQPGTFPGERVNQIDFRVAKVLQFGGTRTTIGLDLYNVLNSDAVLGYNQAFIPGGQWLVPTSVLTARLARINVDVRF